MRGLSRIAVVAASVFIPSLAFANKVWVVSSSGTGDFVHIQPAVDVAEEGDTILVKAGTYTSFTINNKTLSVVADSGNAVSLVGKITVQNLASGKFVLVGGINVNSSLQQLPAMQLSGNLGSVRAQGLVLLGYPCAVRAFDNADVFFTECTITGWDGLNEMGGLQPPQRGGHGLELRSTDIALYDCSIRGGRGGNCSNYSDYAAGGYGGDACLIANNGGTLFASNSNFTGGPGGNGGHELTCTGFGFPASSGGNGGRGITISSSSHANLLGGSTQGGSGGAAGISFCDPNDNGSPGLNGAGIHNPLYVTILPGNTKQLFAPLVIRENNDLGLLAQGLPGDTVHLEISRETTFQYFPTFKGVLQIPQPPTTVVTLGQTPGSGELPGNYFFPEMGPRRQSRVYFLQTLHRAIGGEQTLGTGRAVVVLDQAF